ncbi:MAG TPA: chemotaxis protein CheW [Polyangia bacterium]|jgi:purine-binding chemotaxis protein CheW|nr:chemotaxis protein CheW [Polyangia bacterium]
MESYVLFLLAGQRYGVTADRVEEIARAVSVAPLPAAPPLVEGAVDWRGRIVAVLDLRGRFRLPPKPPALTDHLILARSRDRSVALRVDEVSDVVRLNATEIVPAREAIPGVGMVAGIVRSEDGLILIQDLDSFLSDAELDALDRAVAAHA